MDIANIRVIIAALLMIGLVSGQVNFSTSWGKRSSSLIPSPASSAQRSYLAMRQKFHSNKETAMESQPTQRINTLPQSDSVPALTIYEDTEDQPSSLPSPCLSLVKVLMLVNQLVENELQKMEKYDRQQQQ